MRQVLRASRRAGVDHVATHLPPSVAPRGLLRRCGYLTTRRVGLTLTTRPLADLPVDPLVRVLVGADPRRHRGLLMSGARRLPVAEMLAIAVVGCYLAAMAWSFQFGYNIWGAFVIGPALVAVNIPLLRAAMRREAERRLALLVVVGFSLKLLAAIPRYLVAFVLYGGTADAATYDSFGSTFAQQFRHGDFTVDVGRVVGTGFIKIFTGVVYTITGSSLLGGFLVFSMLGFWGIYLCYRAFVVCLPDADHWLYGRLVFLLPSMLFWPSGLGKEAWMLLCIGMIAYGAARLYTRRRGGFAASSASASPAAPPSGRTSR